FAAVFLPSAVVLAMRTPAAAPLSLIVILALIATYALFAATSFPIGDGFAAPLQIVFVPMMLVAPALAPLEVMLGMALFNGVAALRGGFAPSRLLTSVSDSVFALGPVLVLVLGGATHGPDWADWPLYVVALAVQFACDIAVSVV